jgi:hypothetical protein
VGKEKLWATLLALGISLVLRLSWPCWDRSGTNASLELLGQKSGRWLPLLPVLGLSAKFPNDVKINRGRWLLKFSLLSFLSAMPVYQVSKLSSSFKGNLFHAPFSTAWSRLQAWMRYTISLGSALHVHAAIQRSQLSEYSTAWSGFLGLFGKDVACIFPVILGTFKLILRTGGAMQ